MTLAMRTDPTNPFFFSCDPNRPNDDGSQYQGPPAGRSAPTFASHASPTLRNTDYCGSSNGLHTDPSCYHKLSLDVELNLVGTDETVLLDINEFGKAVWYQVRAMNERGRVRRIWE